MYNEVKRNVFATGSVPDGYFGNRMNVGFSFNQESGKTLIVHSMGFYRSGLPSAIDTTEAFWLLKHHPLAKNYSGLKLTLRG